MRIKNIFDRRFTELTGCIHNHSVYSFDSRIPISRIIRAAKKNALDYVTINDHMNMDAGQDKAVIEEKDLIIIIGAEINDPDKNNHLLVFNTDEIIKDKEAGFYVSEYKKAGAITFAAHPYEKRKDESFRKYLWTDHSVDQFNGLEIWNFLSEWVGKLKPSLNGLFMVMCPSFFVTRPYRANISWWDRMNREGKRKSAIGSVDCHEESYKKFWITFRFLKHRNIFKTIRTNVLIPEGEAISNASILRALNNGNSYIVNYKMGDPYNFYFGVKGEQNSAIMGEEIPLESKMKLYFRLPRLSRVHIVHNGNRLKTVHDDKGEFAIKEKGFYRLEVTNFGRGWIYTNNIYIT